MARKTIWTDDMVAAAINHVDSRSLLVFPNLTITACRDPDDNRVLECAVAGHADLILSGDKDLLTLGSYNDIPILTIRQFLDLDLT